MCYFFSTLFTNRKATLVPHLEILTLHTPYASFPHCLALTDMSLNKTSILLKKNTNTKKKHAYCKNYDTINKNFQLYFLILWSIMVQRYCYYKYRMKIASLF